MCKELGCFTGSSLSLLLSYLKGVVVICNLEVSTPAGVRNGWVMEEQWIPWKVQCKLKSQETGHGM